MLSSERVRCNIKYNNNSNDSNNNNSDNNQTK